LVHIVRIYHDARLTKHKKVEINFLRVYNP